MINPDTLRFLEDLRNNNNRDWFLANNSRFDNAKSNLEDLAARLITNISGFDPGLAELEASRTIFRQYRDIRFSADKTPYKVHMGAFFNKGGKHINNAGYYLHIEPGKSLYAGGFWMPEPKHLASIRQEIDYNYDEWKEIITSKAFLKYFPNGIDKTGSLTRPPKGYDNSNPALEFLKLKSFTAMTYVSDKILTGKSFERDLVKAYEAISPMIRFLNRSVE